MSEQGHTPGFARFANTIVGGRFRPLLMQDCLMRVLRLVVLAMYSIWLLGGPALADQRVALVIGNSAYQNVHRLPNPANDAAAMSSTLKSAGFDVVQLRRDLKANEMRRALRDFSDKVRGADIAV